MLRILGLISSLLLSCLNLQAQPTLTLNSQTPTFTEHYTAEYIDLISSFDPGPAGPNQSWDFSNLPASDLSAEFIVGPTSFGSASEDYPDADFVWIFAGLGISNYYDLEGDNMRLLGGVTVGPSGQVFNQVIFTEGENALQFPITYNTSYSYSSAFDVTSFGGFMFSGTRTGTVTADAYGTLFTPFGTYDNVLRLVISSTSSDGITEEQYSWLQAGTFIPLMVYSTSTDPEVVDNVYYSRFDGISATEEVSFDYGLRIASNPVREQLLLAGDLVTLPKLNVQVINQNGQPIQRPLVGNSIDVSGAPSGTYYLILSGENGRQLLPFVKQ